MVATCLLGASRIWASCGLPALPVPGGPGTLFIWAYAKMPVMKGTKVTKGSMATEALKDPEVCTDPIQLTTHAMGINMYKEGQDVALKPDPEYTEWLFQMNLGPPKMLEELEPESHEYW
ncbi:39S ribosomal protein L54, mitochondrial [Sigmodon hispidus]